VWASDIDDSSRLVPGGVGHLHVKVEAVTDRNMVLSSSGRYAVLGTLSAGGTARVYLGRMSTGAGFSRLVAIKELHGHVADDEAFVAMLLDEAKLSAQIRHPNVVATVDVVASGATLRLIMDYVEGASLAELLGGKARAGKVSRVPPRVATAIAIGVLRGLHAAHTATNDGGVPLGIVHRDVSPQNILVGIDGAPRVIDFGIAKALGRLGSTPTGVVRGKMGYMAPEQLLLKPTTQAVDIYATGVVLWEMLTGERYVTGEEDSDIARRVLDETPRPPSTVASEVGGALDAVVIRALALDVSKRFPSAAAMADELERLDVARSAEVGRLVEERGGASLTRQRDLVRHSHSPDEYRPLEEVLESFGNPSAELSSPEPRARERAQPPPRPTAARRRWVRPVVLMTLMAGATSMLVIGRHRESTADGVPSAPRAAPSAESAPLETTTAPEPRPAEGMPTVASSTPSPSAIPRSKPGAVFRKHPPEPQDPRTRR
jgi:serine/threonine-protein kinase